VSEAESRILNLTAFNLSLELLVDFICHANTGGTDRMAETLQSAIRLTREGTVKIEEAGVYIFFSTPPLGDEEVFVNHQFGD
jgi:hypothetical protein